MKSNYSLFYNPIYEDIIDEDVTNNIEKNKKLSFNQVNSTDDEFNNPPHIFTLEADNDQHKKLLTSKPSKVSKIISKLTNKNSYLTKHQENVEEEMVDNILSDKTKSEHINYHHISSRMSTISKKSDNTNDKIIGNKDRFTKIDPASIEEEIDLEMEHIDEDFILIGANKEISDTEINTLEYINHLLGADGNIMSHPLE